MRAWAMAAFFFADGRRELRRVPLPAPVTIRIVEGALARPFVHDVRSPPAPPPRALGAFFRLRRITRPGARLIYDEVASTY